MSTTCENKIKNILQSDFSLDEFTDTNFFNFLEFNPEALCAEGAYSIKNALCSNNKREYDKIIAGAFPPESLNPKKKYLPEEYFVETQVWREIDAGLTELIQNINEDGKILFLACAKSTGKTLSQNIWIKRNDALMEGKKIFWIRCDCEKLVNLVRSFGFDNLSKIEENLVENYFDIQFLSVLCKNYNSEDRPFFQQIFQELIDVTVRLRKSGDYKTPIYKDNVPVLNVIEEFHNRIIEFKKSKGYKYNYGREVVLKSSIGKTNHTMKVFDDWSHVSETIQQILIKKGYKFLRIIDSVDNYKKYDNNGDYQEVYRFVLDKICKFNHDYIENQKQEGHVAIIVRKNTYWDYLAFYNQSKRKSAHGNSVSEKLIDQNGIQDKISIQEKRYELLEKSQHKSVLLKLLKKIIEYKPPEQSFLYEFLNYDKHIGFLLRNKISLVPALCFFQEKYEMSDTTLDTFLDSYLPSNLLLNGHFSLNSSYRPEIELGRMLFNIFHYNEHTENKFKWHGLCSTRILQLLQKRHGMLNNNLIKEINELFCYDENVIKIAVSRLLEFALLRLDRNEKKSEDGKEIENPYVMITEKGKASLNLIYSDFDILYHSSLDTPMPESLINKSFIYPHSNKKDIRNYAVCCLKTTLSFIQYLKKIDRDERTYIDNLNNGTDSQDYHLSINFNEKIRESLEKRCNHLMSSLKPNILNDLNTFLDNFKEIEADALPAKNIDMAKAHTISEGTLRNSSSDKSEQNPSTTTIIAQVVNVIDRSTVDFSINKNINIELNNCVINFQEELKVLARDLRNAMSTDDADYVEEVVAAVGKAQEIINTTLNETEIIEKIKGKRWSGKIKEFFKELADKNSDLYKNTAKLRNGARIYNDIVKMIPGLKAILPEIPNSILNIGT